MDTHTKTGRRSFLQKASAAIVAGSLISDLSLSQQPATVKNKILKVGLIGCGGRGNGAAAQALQADPDVILTSVGDIFMSQAEQSLKELKELFPDRVQVKPENIFIGFDAYKKVIATDVDVVLLTTPPAFRPEHLDAAINAGKHAFAEKPVAIDAPGVRKVLAATKKAKEKNLAIVSGFCFRYDFPKRAFYDKIRQGGIGDVVSVTTTRNGGGLWVKEKQPEWTDMEYKLKNWLYYNWLCGDFICEMMVHSLDLMAWAMGDKTPLKVTGTGGRQVRVQEAYGNVYDHFAIEFEYPDGIRCQHFSRQQENCSNTNTVSIGGTKGRGFIDIGAGLHQLSGATKWTYSGERNNMYETQHIELFASLRKGKPVNEGEKLANSTLLGVMSRMAAYTGQTITWEQALNSTEVLGPPMADYHRDLIWNNYTIAKPGITKFS